MTTLSLPDLQGSISVASDRRPLHLLHRNVTMGVPQYIRPYRGRSYQLVPVGPFQPSVTEKTDDSAAKKGTVKRPRKIAETCGPRFLCASPRVLEGNTVTGVTGGFIAMSD